MDYLWKLFGDNRQKKAPADAEKTWMANIQSVSEAAQDLAQAFWQTACADINLGNLQSAGSVGEVAHEISEWIKQSHLTPTSSLSPLQQFLSRQHLSNEKAHQAVQAVAPLVDSLQQVLEASNEIPLTEIPLREVIERRLKTLSAELLVVAQRLAGERLVFENQHHFNQLNRPSVTSKVLIAQAQSVSAAQAQLRAAIKALADALRGHAVAAGDAGRMSEMITCYNLVTLLENRLDSAFIYILGASRLVPPAAKALQTLLEENADFDAAFGKTLKSIIACLQKALQWQSQWGHLNSSMFIRLLQLIAGDMGQLAFRIRGGEANPAEEGVYYCQKVSPVSQPAVTTGPGDSASCSQENSPVSQAASATGTEDIVSLCPKIRPAVKPAATSGASDAAMASALVLWNKGHHHYSQDDYAAAVPFFAAAAKAKREPTDSASEYPPLHSILNYLAESLRASNQYPEAEKAYRDEYKVWQASQEPFRVENMCRCFIYIANIQYRRGAYSKAEATYRTVLILGKNKLSPVRLQECEEGAAKCRQRTSA